METQLEGIVHALHYDPSAEGKQFLGAAIASNDGNVWVIHYDEQSPFHPFAGRQVVAFGETYKPLPQSQYLISWRGSKKLGHFRVSTIRLQEVTLDAELIEVGSLQELRGRFERTTTETREARLTFVTDGGDAFPVANDPAGATVGQSEEVLAYPVQRFPSTLNSSGKWLWIICPCSAADLSSWRERHR